LAINPDDVVALIYSHDANLAVGDMSAATEQLSKLIALFPNDFRVLQRQIEQRLQMRLVSGEEGKLTKKMQDLRRHTIYRVPAKSKRY